MALKNASHAVEVEFDPEALDRAAQGQIVPIGSGLPHNVQIPTGKLLDVLMALAPGTQRLNAKQKKDCRAKFQQKLYLKTRPGFCMRIAENLHLGYAGQPEGHGKQHHWRLFYDDQLKERIEALAEGRPSPEANAKGHYQLEWGGLYLRSEAERRIAEALYQRGILFFANSRGLVSLDGAAISNTELNGRVEVDFLVFHQGQCLVLEVDGQHHLEGEQAVRDYARDRMLLRAGLPTIRFTGKNCLERPQAVVEECLSILQAQSGH
jgi:very-short-patch-repair endonuclease